MLSSRQRRRRRKKRQRSDLRNARHPRSNHLGLQSANDQQRLRSPQKSPQKNIRAKRVIFRSVLRLSSFVYIVAQKAFKMAIRSKWPSRTLPLGRPTNWVKERQFCTTWLPSSN